MAIRNPKTISDVYICIDGFGIVTSAKFSRTKKVRPSTNKKLLIRYIRPHGPVSRDTVSRLIRAVMIKSGIDVTVYGAHSVRSASASKARDNTVPITVNMKRAGWTVDSTFKKYYSLNIEEDLMFENAVLQ